MTNEEEQMITMMFIKHGGFEAVVDMWLYNDEELSVQEFLAVDAWLNSEQAKPMNIKLHTAVDAKYQYVTAEISCNTLDKG